MENYLNKILFLTFLKIGTICLSQNSEYQIDNVNAQTIASCKGKFTDSKNCGSGINTDYCSNENYWVTFDSGSSSQRVRLNFLKYNLELNHDSLLFYDGQFLTSPFLSSITGYASTGASTSSTSCASVAVITSTSRYLTVRFKSDASINYNNPAVAGGFLAFMGCEPLVCNTGSDPAADECMNAPQICDMNNYCGNTGGWYTSGLESCNLGTNFSGSFCGTIENNSWVKFVASTTTAIFNITSSNCSNSTSGIQAIVYSTTDCNTFVAKSNCINQNTGSGNAVLTANSLIPGNTYYIMVDGVSGNNCDYTIQTVSGVSTVSVSSSLGTHFCPNSTTTLTANAQGTTTYSWSSIPAGVSGNTATIDVSPSVNTTYTCTITGACGGEVSSSISIVVEMPYASFTVDTLICKNEFSNFVFTGYPNSTVSYAYTGGPVNTIALDNNGSASISTAIGNPFTVYHLINVYYNNQLECIQSLTDSLTIEMIDLGELHVTSDTICLGEQINLFAIPDIEGGTFLWDTPNNDVTNNILVSPLYTSSYIVNYTKICTISDTGFVVVNPIPIQSLIDNSPLCENDTLFLTSLFITDASYQWSGPNGFTSTDQNPNLPNVSLINKGIYVLTTELNDCFTLDSLNIMINPNPIVDFKPDIFSGCSPLIVTFYNLSQPMSSTSIWDFGDGTQSTLTDSVTHQFDQVGSFSISLSSTTNGCSNDTSKINLISVNPSAIASFESHVVNGNQYQFTNTSSNANSYSWSISNNSTYNSTDVLTILPPSDTSYFVQLIASNQYNCLDTSFKYIEVDEELVFYIPNTFTPDGDDFNAFFHPIFTSGFEPDDFNLEIFNRWGELIFSCNDFQKGWDGSFNNQEAQDGTYIWRIQFLRKNSDEKVLLNGHISLLR